MNKKIDKFPIVLNLIKNTDTNVFLTGKAGTGKTTFLKQIKKECKGKSYVVIAPTGVAAVQAGGATMHSFFQLPLGAFLPDRGGIKKEINEYKSEIIKNLDLLIIDEVSMVRADMLDAIDCRLRQVRSNEKPFGGVQLLLIGDLFQLPPVAVDKELQELKKYYKSMYFFESKALAKTSYIAIEVEKIFRQENADFKEILNSIREGQVTDNQLELLNMRYIPDFKAEPGEYYLRLVTHNKQVEEINKKEMSLLHGEECTYQAKIKGYFPESAYPTPASLTLKVGAHVMFTKKNKEKGYDKGTLGIVTHLGDEYISVELLNSEDGNKKIKVTQETWENIDYVLLKTFDENEKSSIREKSVGTFTQFPLQQAWAITIHKSQGLTFDRAIIDVSHSFTDGQTYVALSRCRTLRGLVLSEEVNSASIKCASRVKDFCKRQTPVQDNFITDMSGKVIFKCNNNATNIEIPDGVTDIMDLAFENCSSLISITIPKTVSRIGKQVFRGCKKLQTIIVACSNKYYKDIDGVLLSKDGKTIIRYPSDYKASISNSSQAEDNKKQN